jgi:hypothetical protein
MEARALVRTHVGTILDLDHLAVAPRQPADLLEPLTGDLNLYLRKTRVYADYLHKGFLNCRKDFD